jgi:hypothetical protein
VSPSTHAKIMTLWARAGTLLPIKIIAVKKRKIKNSRIL